MKWNEFNSENFELPIDKVGFWWYYQPIKRVGNKWKGEQNHEEVHYHRYQILQAVVGAVVGMMLCWRCKLVELFNKKVFEKS